MTVTDYLRKQQLLTGTKVVCAEGDCGACTVLVGTVSAGQQSEDVAFIPINACIQFMHGLDGCHLITIEGITPQDGTLHPVQQALVDAQATQCGFCTPGFVMAAAGMLEATGGLPARNAQQAKNYLTGNLCRCTGYQSIIEAMLNIDHQDKPSVPHSLHHPKAHQDLQEHLQQAVNLSHQQHSYQAPVSLQTAASLLHETGHRLFGAATDLGVQHNKGHWHDQQVISLHLVPASHQLLINDSETHIGARVTLATLEEQLAHLHPEWSAFMHVFASPQIKNNGTLIGNIANGSPIGDNLPFLLALDAIIHIQGPDQQRQVNINDFYLGYRHNDLQAGELISHVGLPHKAKNSFLRLYKASRRRDLDISSVGCAFYLVLDDQQRVQQASLALGGVAATALRISAAEALLSGLTPQQLANEEHLSRVCETLNQHITPMSDVRGSEAFRRQLVSNYYRRFITELNQDGGADHEV